MLGIRRYQGTAIDLWQGDLKKFVCDAAVVFFPSGSPKAGLPPVAGLPPGEAMNFPARESGYPASQLLLVSYVPAKSMTDRDNLGSILGSYSNALAFSASLGVRHVAMAVPQSGELGDLYGSLAMVALKSFIDEFSARQAAGTLSRASKYYRPQRITLVMDDLPVYDCFQAQLFAAFPDLP